MYKELVIKSFSKFMNSKYDNYTPGGVVANSIYGNKLDSQVNSGDLNSLSTGRKYQLVRDGVNASIAGLGLYGLYKLIKKLQSKQSRTTDEDKQLSIAKQRFNELKQSNK